MPGGRGNGAKEIVLSVKSGKVPESVLDDAVDRIIDVAIKGQQASMKISSSMGKKSDLGKKICTLNYVSGAKFEYNQMEHHEIARKIAEETIVLLKNDDDILPIRVGRLLLLVKWQSFRGIRGLEVRRLIRIRLRMLMIIFWRMELRLSMFRDMRGLNLKMMKL